MTDYTSREGARILASRYPSMRADSGRRPYSRLAGTADVERQRARMVKLYPTMVREIDTALGLAVPGGQD